MALFLKSFLAPQLYWIYKTETTAGFAYRPNTLETWGDRIILFVRLFYKATVWTWPVVSVYLLWRGYLSYPGAVTLARLVAYLAALAAAASLLRAVGRVSSQHYRVFVTALADDAEPQRRRRRLAGYDFDFHTSAWPVDFVAQRRVETPAAGASPPLEHTVSLPARLLSYCVVHTIGRRLMFPGSIGFMNLLLAPALLEGRTKMVEVLGGQRHVLQAADGNRIDTMFVDRRNRKDVTHGRGDKLVICCEGNAGFYEIGSTSAPLEAEYSVLGWNHPGFAGSSGVPMPESEQNAVAVVMEFAQRRLGFRAEDIVLYAWSIGGYAATWAAMTHPHIAGVVLDATFDDVLPLAVSRMPPSWDSLVRLTCRLHLDLNNGRQLSLYNGPVLLVRRTMDEVITTTEQEVATNRANDLLLLLLRNRYPNLVDDVTIPQLERWVRGDATGQAEVMSEVGVEDELCLSLLTSYVLDHSAAYPFTIGADLSGSTRTQLILYLASRMMVGMEGTHCSPMPGSFFRLPAEQPSPDDYVFVSKQRTPTSSGENDKSDD